MAFVKVFFVVFLGDTGDEGSISRMLREEMFSARNNVDFKGGSLRDSLQSIPGRGLPHLGISARQKNLSGL